MSFRFAGWGVANLHEAQARVSLCEREGVAAERRDLPTVTRYLPDVQAHVSLRVREGVAAERRDLPNVQAGASWSAESGRHAPGGVAGGGADTRGMGRASAHTHTPLRHDACRALVRRPVT